jgi:hypothetical protein
MFCLLLQSVNLYVVMRLLHLSGSHLVTNYCQDIEDWLLEIRNVFNQSYVRSAISQERFTGLSRIVFNIFVSHNLNTEKLLATFAYKSKEVTF